MATIKKIYNQEGMEIGAIIFAILHTPIDIQQKTNIENYLKQHAFNVLYPGEGINIYSDIHVDTASITVIRNINQLPDEYNIDLPL